MAVLEEAAAEDKMEEEIKESKKTITIEKITIWKGVSAVLTILLVISIFTNGFGFKSENKDAEVAQPAQLIPEAPTKNINMDNLADDDAVKGDKKAPITIIEWSDYECPFCVIFYKETLGKIDTEYIKTGKVKLIYRDFPLGFHANAQKAAEAAECAGEQGKYYEMHNKLFEDGVDGGVASFKKYAAEIGLNTGKFDKCLDSGAMASEIQKDMQDGQAAGISGTPGFIINGQLISGAQPFSAFKQVIDAELS